MWNILQRHNPFHLFYRKRSRAQRAYEKQFSRSTLFVQKQWQFFLFLFGKYRFEAGDWLQEQRTSLFILAHFTRSIFGSALLAILLVVGLEFLEHLLLAPGGPFWHFALSVWFVHQAKLLLNHFDVTLSKMQLDNSTYVSLVSTVAQIAGIFLGLYFTAVGVVVSAVYSRVPGDVRALLVQERMGNLYMRVVALLCAVAVLVLAIHALGFPIGILNLSLLTVLSLLSIFRFMELGRRIFDFFNPAVLVGYLNRDLQKSIRRATSHGFQWHNPSFQRAYQNHAESLLNSYHNIVFLVTHEEHPYGKTLLALAKNALSLLAYYAKCKSAIPTKSYWFRQTHQHPSWLTSNYAHIKLALSTGTALQPTVVPESLWLETMIEEIIKNILQTLLEKNDLRSAVAVMDIVRLTVEIMAEQFAIEEAFHLQATLRPIILAHARREKSKDVQSENHDEQSRYILSLIELSSFIPITMLLGFTRSLQSIPVTTFAYTINRIRWKHRKDIYITELPRSVIEQLEYLRERLALEQFVEGRLISPVWLRQQISALGFVRFLSKMVNLLVGTLESTYPIQVEILLKEKSTLLAAQLIQTGLEACQKYKGHFEDVREYTEQLASLRRVTDTPWTVIDWDDVDKRIRMIRTRLVISLGQIVLDLAALSSSEQLPDYFGLAYSVLSQEAYLSMATGDETLFQRIIPSVFAACLLAPSRVADKLQNIDMTMRFIYSTEPFEDILELSGYALIFSALDGKGFWDTIKALWNKDFAQQPIPQEKADYIINIIKSRRKMLTMFPRSLVRTTWKQDLEGRLRDRGLLNNSYSYEPWKGRHKWHASPIIRALTRTGRWNLFDNPLDVFLVVFAREKNIAWHLNLPREAEPFADALQQEEMRDNDTKES